MASPKPLLLWLQHWQLSLSSPESISAWTLLPKGTEVYFLSHRWLKLLFSVLQSHSDLSQVPLDNSDIRSPYDYSQLRSESIPTRDFAVVPASVFHHVFLPFLYDSEETMRGFVVWGGLFTPKLVSAPYTLPGIVEVNGNLYSADLVLDATIPVAKAVQKLTLSLSFSSDSEKVVWTSDHCMTRIALSEMLAKHEEMAGYLWIREMERDGNNVLAGLNSQVMFVEVRKKKSWISGMVKWATNSPSVGLKNVGKSCFLNAVLQCLVHTYEFALLFVNHESSTISRLLLCALQELIKTVLLKRAKTFNPEDIYSALFGAERHRDEEDAHLVLMELFAHLTHGFQEPPEVPLPLIPDDPAFSLERAWLTHTYQSPLLFSHIFGGLALNSMTCCLCGHSTSSASRFQTLFLNLPASKVFRITLISADRKKLPVHFRVESSSPVESIETVTNIWREIASEQGVRDFIIGEAKGKLFVPTGLTNMAVKASYIVMELPCFSTDSSLIIVDIYSKSLSQVLTPLATRIFPLPHGVPVSQVSRYLVSYLCEIYDAYLTRKLKISTWIQNSPDTQTMYHILSGRTEVYPTSLNWATCGGGELDLSEMKEGEWTVREVCDRSEAKMARFRMIVMEMPRGVVGALQERCGEKTIFFGSMFADSSDVTLTFLQMLEYTLADKPLNEEDVILCSHCSRSSQHISSLHIVQFPRVAVFCLQRARLQPSGLAKSEVLIQYPTSDLDLSPFEKATACDRPIYDLTGVVHHKGGLSKGHYKAHAKHPITSKWHIYDDTSTQEVNEQGVIDEKQAYLLFYSRRYSAGREA